MSGPRGRPRRTSITTRAIALVVVVLVLTISYANSVRIYFAQTQQIAATKADIADRQQRIADLESQAARWNDPAWVKIQARERLGWAVPGETGYTVVDSDGNPVGGGTDLTTPDAPPVAPSPAWYAKLWGSVETADRPAPKPTPKPKKPKPITVDSKPSTKKSPG